MINEDTLMLYFYRDGLSDDEIRRISEALEQDTELRARYDELCEHLSALGQAEPIDAPPGATARWRAALDAQIGARSPRSLFDWFGGSGMPLAAAAALVFVVGVFVGGRFTSTLEPIPGAGPVVAVDQSPPDNTPGIALPPRNTAVFVRGVAAHLEETQVQLVSMDLENTRERDALVEKIISQNRFYLKAADDNGADDVARLLRAFEPLLMSISDGQVNDRTPAENRDQLEFELGVMLTKFNRRASNRTNEF